MRTCGLFFLLSLSFLGQCAEFVVEDIVIEGLQRISPGSVLNYLSARKGQVFDSTQASNDLRTLYKTGQFTDVRIGHKNGILQVVVTERPSIDRIEISGSKKIKEPDLRRVLKESGIFKGYSFRHENLARIRQELLLFFYNNGFYNTQLAFDSEQLPRNRVALTLKITEGDASRIRYLNVIGNQYFNEEDLLRKLSSDISHFDTFTRRDLYSRAQLEGDLERLRSFYFDHGFARMQILSTQVGISTDRRHIGIIVDIEEGQRYHIQEIRFNNQSPLSSETLTQLLSIPAGSLFSRKHIEQGIKRIEEQLGELGYAFAQAQMRPVFQEHSKEFILWLDIQAGDKVYVRHIRFSGNAKSQEQILRRELRQFEGTRLSPQKLDRSRQRLLQLPYIAEVQIDTLRLPDKPNWVDLHIRIQERDASWFNIGASISEAQTSMIVGVGNPSLFGSGNALSLNIDEGGHVYSQYRLRYTNPYYSNDGISRTIDGYYLRTDSDTLSSSSYQTNGNWLGTRFGIPLSEYETLHLGARARTIEIKKTVNSSTEIDTFITRYKSLNSYLLLQLGYRYDNRDRGLFTTEGVRHELNLHTTPPGGKLEYYKANYDLSYYHPLRDWLVFSFDGNIAYGNGFGELDQLPFFDNYNAGGIYSLRGFSYNSLGPRDSTDRAFGGDLLTLGTLQLFFPPSLNAEEQGDTRLSLFLDGGNVFADHQHFNSAEYRYSIGAALSWNTPMGPLSFSLAHPLNAKPEDFIQQFQFSFGSLF